MFPPKLKTTLRMILLFVSCIAVMSLLMVGGLSSYKDGLAFNDYGPVQEGAWQDDKQDSRLAYKHALFKIDYQYAYISTHLALLGYVNSV